MAIAGPIILERLEVEGEFFHQEIELDLFGAGEAGHHAADACRMLPEHAAEEAASGCGEGKLAGTLIAWNGASADESGAFKAVDDTGNTRRLDEQTTAQVAKEEAFEAFILSALEGAEDAPLGAADAFADEIGLHEGAKESGGADKGPKRPGGKIRDVLGHIF